MKCGDCKFRKTAHWSHGNYGHACTNGKVGTKFRDWAGTIDITTYVDDDITTPKWCPINKETP